MKGQQVKVRVTWPLQVYQGEAVAEAETLMR
jgi:hypothetical protein